MILRRPARPPMERHLHLTPRTPGLHHCLWACPPTMSHVNTLSIPPIISPRTPTALAEAPGPTHLAPTPTFVACQAKPYLAPISLNMLNYRAAYLSLRPALRIVKRTLYTPRPLPPHAAPHASRRAVLVLCSQSNARQASMVHVGVLSRVHLSCQFARTRDVTAVGSSSSSLGADSLAEPCAAGEPVGCLPHFQTLAIVTLHHARPGTIDLERAGRAGEWARPGLCPQRVSPACTSCRAEQGCASAAADSAMKRRWRRNEPPPPPPPCAAACRTG